MLLSECTERSGLGCSSRSTRLGLLINFGARLLKHELVRIANPL